MATEVVIPVLGITVERGKIVEWVKNEGDSVKKGETIFIVETDKVVTEVESPASGILARILILQGIEVPVLTVVAVITAPGEQLPAEYEARADDVPPAITKMASQAESKSKLIEVSSDQHHESGPVRLVPAARKLAHEKGIDPKTIRGTGPDGIILVKDVTLVLETTEDVVVKTTPLARKVAEERGISLKGLRGTGVKGRIMRADIEKAIEEKKAPEEPRIIPMGKMRKVIARRMSESAFSAPHICFFTDVIMDPLLDFRNDILPDCEKEFGLRPSVNDLLIKAVALNLLDFPLLNSMLKGDDIHILTGINIGFAVALSDGLMVPAIANADKTGLAEICRQRTDLSQRAKSGKLTMVEIERGTFTISSLAQYDITSFTAILNPPQSGILSVGKTRQELAMIDGAVKERKVSTLGLSVDHRIIDGAFAADFLQNLKWKLERPWLMFLAF